MGKKTAPAGLPKIKALVTENGNYLVNYKGIFFYMDSKGNRQKSKFETNNPGKMLRSQEWEWALRGWKKDPILLTKKLLKLAEAAKNNLLSEHGLLPKEEPAPIEENVLVKVKGQNVMSAAGELIKNVHHVHTPLAGLKELVEK